MKKCNSSAERVAFAALNADMTTRELAEHLGISMRTAQRYKCIISKARASE